MRRFFVTLGYLLFFARGLYGQGLPAPLPHSVSGAVPSVGSTLVINTVGMGTLLGELTTAPNDTYIVEAALDTSCSVYSYTVPVAVNRVGTDSLSSVVLYQGAFNTAPWSGTPTFRANVAGTQCVRIRKTAGAGSGSWTLSAAPQSAEPFAGTGVQTSGTLTNNGDVIVLNGTTGMSVLYGNNTARGGAYNATVLIEGADFAGNWTQVLPYMYRRSDNGAWSLSTDGAVPATFGQNFIVNIAGFTAVRLRQSTVSAGSISSWSLQATTGAQQVEPSVIFGANNNGVNADNAGNLQTNVNNTVAVSAASLPLPTNAATAGNQTTGNTSLSSLDTKTPTLTRSASATLGTQVTIDGTGMGTVSGISAAFSIDTYVLEGTVDGSNYIALPLVLSDSTPNTVYIPSGRFDASLLTAPVSFRANASGFTTIRLRNTTSFSSVSWTIRVSPASAPTIANSTGQATMANSQPVAIASNQSAIPVSGPLTDTQLRASAVPVSGTFFQATQPVSGPLTDTQLRATAVPVSGTFFQATQPVSGTFWQATQPVSGPLTDTQLRATAVPVSGPLTDTQLRASAVPVSGTFWQATQPVSGTFWQATQPVSIASMPSTPVTGTFWQATQPVSSTQLPASLVNGSLSTTSVESTRTAGTLTSVTCPGTGCVSVTTTNYALAAVTINGTYSVTPVFEFSDDGTNFYSTTCTRTDSAVQETGGGALVNTLRAWDCSVYGTTSFRVRASAFVSGTANIGIILTGTSIEAAPTVALTAGASINTTINSITPSVQQGIADTGTARVVISQEATYAASTTAKTATAAGTAGFFELCGSASKTVRMQRIMVSGTVATAAVYGDIQIRKNSSAGTGGTATTLTATPFDSNSASATATAKYFTVLPTGGGVLVGNIMSETAFFPLTGTVATMTPQLIYVWRDTDAEAPTLRGVAQCVTAGFGTTTTNAPTLSVSVAWTEK